MKAYLSFSLILTFFDPRKTKQKNKKKIPEINKVIII